METLGNAFGAGREKMTTGFKGNRPYSAKQRVPSGMAENKNLKKPPKLPQLNNAIFGTRLSSGFNMTPMNVTNSQAFMQKKSISDMSMVFPQDSQYKTLA